MQNTLNQLNQYQMYLQYWDNFNLSLLLFCFLLLVYVISVLYKQPDWKLEEYKKSIKRKVLRIGWRFLLISFILNLFVSIWL